MTETNNEDYKSLGIMSPSVLYIIKTIKAIQKRMKDPDLVNSEYIRVYNQLSDEFSDFIEKYGYINIFTKVIKGDDLSNLCCILFYKDKVQKGEMTEAELSELVFKKFMPEGIQKEVSKEIMNDKTN